MTRVVCPMCETPGFISPQMAGKEVKCCNPKCLMPIFTAPAPEPEKTEEPPRHTLSGRMFAALAVLLIAGVGAGLYYFFVREPGDLTLISKTSVPGKSVPVVNENETPDPSATETTEPVGPPPVSLDEVRETSLVDIAKAAQQRQNNRSRMYGRRLAAEGFAQAGEIDKAREQLEAMRKLQGYVAFYEIEPLVLIATHLREAGDTAAADAALNEALSKAELPELGREPLSAAAVLATALVEAGRLEEARSVAAKAPATGIRGQVFVLWRMAVDSGTLNVAAPARRPYIQTMPDAQWIAVTEALLSHGRADDALKWAQSAEDPAVRDSALAAWAGSVARSQPAGEGALPASVTAVIESLEPAGRARVWAALADAARSRKDSAAVQECLAQASAALEGLPVPEPAAVPSLKAIYESEGQPRAGLPDPSGFRNAALAAIDLAHLTAEEGQMDRAAAWVLRALEYLRGSTPSPAATQALLDECEKNKSSVDAQLTSELGIEPVRLLFAFNRYRKQCTVLHDEATARFDFQIELLRRVARAGVLEPLWKEIVAREQQSAPSEREPYFETFLPGTIAIYAQAYKQAELTEQIRQAIPGRNLKVDTRDTLATRLPQAVELGNLKLAGDMLRQFQQQEPGDYYTVPLHALQAVSRLLAEGNHAKALELTLAINEPITREEALLLVAAAAVRDDAHSDLWRKRQQMGLSATELASLYRGFLLGLSLRPAESTPAEPAPATAEVGG